MPYKHLTEKQETFCLKFYELRNASEAYRLAGYSQKYGAHNVWELLKSPLVQVRLNELKQIEEGARQELEVQSIMAVIERKQKLSVIGRADLTDFVDGEGNIELEGGNSEAIAELSIEDWRGVKDEHVSSRTKKVKLHSPIQAIDLLNKMEKIYSDGATINIQQNVVWVIGKGYQENADNQFSIQTDQQDSK